MTLPHSLQARAAAALLDCGAVVFTPDAPITFKSGIRSPVYIDNRRLPYAPPAWQAVIEGLAELIALRELTYDVIAGIAAAGIPHSAALGYTLKRPSVFVRKEAKGHGTRSQIEGGDVHNRHVLLVEDLVTTGGSSLQGVAALREAGATVTDCLCITTYGFADAQHRFDQARVHLHPLVPFSEIVLAASQRGLFGERELAILEAWLRDPQAWGTAPGDADDANAEEGDA